MSTSRRRRRRPPARSRRAPAARWRGARAGPEVRVERRRVARGVRAWCRSRRRRRRTRRVRRPAPSAASRSSRRRRGQVARTARRRQVRPASARLGGGLHAACALRSPVTPSGMHVARRGRARAPAEAGVVGDHQHRADRPGTTARRRRCRGRTPSARARRASSRETGEPGLAARRRLDRHAATTYGSVIGRSGRAGGIARRSCHAASSLRRRPGRPRVEGDGGESARAAAEAGLGVRPRRRASSSRPCSRRPSATWIDGEKIPADRRLHRGRSTTSPTSTR